MRQRLGCLQFEKFPCKQAAHRILDHLITAGFQTFLGVGQGQQIVQSSQNFSASSPLRDKVRNTQSAGLGPLILGFFAGNQNEWQLLKTAKLRGAYPLQQFIAVQLGHLNV
jgi:hypothetical protein